MSTPEIVARRSVYACPWLEVVEKDVVLAPPRGRETFWSVKTGVYVAVLAVTEDGRVPLVRQFRPAVESPVLELPSGGVEADETPEQAIRRELLEETGCEAAELRLVGEFHTDSGRMQTRQWAFFAPSVRVVRDGPVGDEQLELLFVGRGDLGGLIADGSFRMAPHLAVVAAAVAAGAFTL
jgi:ADP-ribose pyrophosphatase